jgi:hypothetical protein
MLYDRPIWALMHDAAADLAPPYRVSDFVAWFGEHYPQVNAKSVRAHVIGLTANDPSRHHYPKLNGMTALFVKRPDRTLIPFDTEAAAGADDADADLSEDAVLADNAALEETAEFALESHLEEFLLGNWQSIAWGRPLQLWQGPDGRSGHQLSTPVGRLDFLCTDRVNGALVVVELKRGRPSDRVVGQIMRYMGYAGTELADPGQAVEGLIIAHEVDDSLRYAVSALPALSLMTYQVAFSLTAVEIPKATAPAHSFHSPG